MEKPVTILDRRNGDFEFVFEIGDQPSKGDWEIEFYTLKNNIKNFTHHEDFDIEA